MIAEQVIVELQAKIAEYKKQLTEAGGHFDRTATGIERRSKLMSERVRIHFGALSLTSYAALAGLPVLLGHLIDKSFEYAASLKEQAQQIGVTAQALQEYRYAAAQVGVEQAALDNGLKTLTLSFGNAEKGAKRPIKALQDLGFNVQEISRIIQTDAATALPEIADKFTKLKGPAQVARDAFGLMGRAGQAMVPLLLQGAAGIDRLRQASEKLGGVLSDAEIEKLHQAEQRYGELKTVLSARIAGAVAENSNAILSLVGSLIKLVNILARIPAAWDHAMAKIAQYDVPFEQKVLDIDRRFGGPGLHPKPGEQTVIQKWLQGNIDAGKQRITSEPYQIPGAKTAMLRPEDLWGAGGIAAGNEDYSGVINKALAGPQKKQTGETPAETLARYIEEEISTQQRINSAKADEAGTVEAKVTAELENSRLQERSDINHIQNDKYYSDAQKASLEGKIHEAAVDERAAILAEQANQKRQDFLDLQSALLNNERDILNAEEAITTDRHKRAEIEKKLLDLALDQERIEAQKVQDDKNASPQAKAAARYRVAMLPIAQAYGYAAINEQNASPGQKYLKELNDGIRDIDDTIQNMEVENLKKLEDFLAGSLAKTLGLSGALGDVVTQLIRIGLQREIIEPIANLLFGGGGWNSGGIVSMLGKLFGGGGGGSFTPMQGGLTSSMVDALPHLAAGGPVKANQPIWVGEHGPEPFIPSTSGTIIPNHMATGGGGVVEVHIVAGEHFDARVASVSGPVAARVVTIAAPTIADLGMGKTANRLTRPRL